MPEPHEPSSAPPPPLGLATWPPRPIPAELEARWRHDGMWTDDSLGLLLDRGLRAQPDLTFTIYSEVQPATGTFAELRADALAVAGALQARGIGPGDPVAFHLPNWREAALSFYAAAFLGAVVVPIVHFYGPKEVGYILRRTGVRALITATSFGPIDFLAGLDALEPDLVDVDVVAVVGLPGASDGRIPFSDLLAGPPLPEPIPVDPTRPALVAYTSGTTADPKGVIHSHRSIGAETRQLSATKAPDQPPQLVGVPVGHAMGMLAALLMPVQRGEPIHLTDVWNPPVILQLMLEHGLSGGSGATYFLTSLLDHPDLTPEHLELMRYVGLGGSAVPAAVAERATGEGLSIVRMYGSTEHPSITGSLHSDPLEKRTTTDGRVLPGVEIRLVDAGGRDVAIGEPGEILSRGPDCFAGYTDPALTEAAFDDDGWFHTEDVGVLDEDGYLRITDRLKDVIIRGGENVSAVEVEELIARLDGVGEVAVVAGPDVRLGERVCAFIRPVSQPPPDLDRVRDSLRDAGLARQKWPEALYVVDDFPRTPSGKIQKAQLRARLQVEHDDR